MLSTGYIFDVEGTLVDTVPQEVLSLQESLADFGIIVARDILQLYTGLDGDQTLRLVAPDLPSEQREQVLHGRAKIYEEKYLASVKPFPVRAKTGSKPLRASSPSRLAFRSCSPEFVMRRVRKRRADTSGS